MKRKISNNVINILACPSCGLSLHISDEGATCANCQLQFGYTSHGALDLRLQRTKTYHYDFTIGEPFLENLDFSFDILPVKSNPEVNFSNIEVPRHLTKELLSHFPKAKASNSLVLDLGCGDTVHKQACELAGFEYVGFDYKSDDAQILGDAHSLPFKDESFDLILSIAVLSMFRFPFVAMKEAYRILRPNGLFIGTVPFLEPFHKSFYHYTHWGTYNLLQASGFNIMYVCPSDRWSVLVAIAKAPMGLFPKMPPFIRQLIVLPIKMLHKAWWRIVGVFSKSVKEDIRVRNTTGSFDFICQK
jgi:SAM-dependent methyltransferase